MFDYIWNTEVRYKNNLISLENKKCSIVPTFWSEHCVECSAPECYSSCSIYKRREDGACVRIINGIQPLGISKLGKKQGALLQFARWGKIECLYDYRTLSKSKVESVYSIWDWLGCNCSSFARKCPGNTRKWIFTRGVYSLRQKFVQKILCKRGIKAENLTLVINAKSEKNLKLIIEIKDFRRILFRECVQLFPDFTTQYIKLPIIQESGYKFLALYPENCQKENNVFVNFLELVDMTTLESEEKKVKCVIWDLDNTLWDGVLIEKEQITLNDKIVNMIKMLDKKGIVNSICSKNDFDMAYHYLEKLDIAEYFVFPKINWNAKSVNIRTTIQQMNISADTVVFVDDSPFEREEVKEGIPEITVVDVTDIEQFISNSRFDVSVNEDSQNRRSTYHMMEQWQSEYESWSGNIDEFLCGCSMQLEIGRPYENEIPRCYELLQRTNQLNASGRRLDLEQVYQYWESSEYGTYILKCSDKYGDYGQIGFAIVKKGTVPRITDFVISCRVANRKVEHTFIKYLAEKSSKNIVEILYKQTSRNGPIFRVVQDLQMQCVGKENELEVYEYSRSKDLIENKVMTIRERNENM